MQDKNLPPGVSEHMIPGNRPEDADAESLIETVLCALEDEGIALMPGVPEADWFCRALIVAGQVGFTRGYNEACVDTTDEDTPDDEPPTAEEYIAAQMVVSLLSNPRTRLALNDATTRAIVCNIMEG